MRARLRAAVTALRMSQTSVTGPIPPGTGVIARARDAASLKLEFAARRVFDPATVYKKK